MTAEDAIAKEEGGITSHAAKTGKKRISLFWDRGVKSKRNTSTMLHSLMSPSPYATVVNLGSFGM